MRAFVITIKDIEKSLDSAQRCIKSGRAFDVNIEMFDAFTPKDKPFEILESKGINTEAFKNNTYSKPENCAAAFLSHYTLWEKCLVSHTEFMILEHDAVFVNNVPAVFTFNKLVNFGTPSYGKFNTPNHLGVGPLTSKGYLPGAHAYVLNKDGAADLIEKAKTDAAPTDIFINLKNFPWLQEYYPWAVEADDSFTTIQMEKGCLAKHNYKEGYKIL